MRAHAQSSLARQIFRVAYKCSAVAASIFCCIGESLFWRLFRRKGRRSGQYALHKWAAWVSRRLSIEVAVEGAPPPHGLIVSNHLSYLDILVFSSIVPCSFVSKHEIKGWPAIGWAARLAGTIFIDRSRRSATRSVQPEMEAAFANEGLLVLFPEATSSDGTTLLPFHSSLFQPMIDAGAPVTAACISYALEEGDPRFDVCYWGEMTLAPHALKLFRKNGVRARVRFGKHTRKFQDRKEAARELWEEINALAHPFAAEGMSASGVATQ
jgi:1-acyl-sn-glycerol-3-phosphate acyltransferase